VAETERFRCVNQNEVKVTGEAAVLEAVVDNEN
jgi:hypothetical protein